MNATELLVTGYNGDQPIFVVNLAPEAATTVLAGDDDGKTVTIDSATKHTTPAFDQFCELLKQLETVPAN